jgi:hypothetical protein
MRRIGKLDLCQIAIYQLFKVLLYPIALIYLLSDFLGARQFKRPNPRQFFLARTAILMAR